MTNEGTFISMAHSSLAPSEYAGYSSHSTLLLPFIFSLAYLFISIPFSYWPVGVFIRPMRVIHIHCALFKLHLVLKFSIISCQDLHYVEISKSPNPNAYPLMNKIKGNGMELKRKHKFI